MKIKPEKKQLAFLDWEMGAFFHFGIRSFFMGHADWDGKEMPAEAFNPKELDCRQWVREVKNAGMTYTILVCKHHDGFANWPTAYSDYSVANTPWKDGKGDVVREYVEACHEYDMKVGLYYSPAQWQGAVSFENDKEYDDYFINQISELLTNYGKIDYLWFDGCGSENHEYDKDRIIHTIRSLQPDILIFSMWDPDTRWVGNEDGYAPLPNPCTVESTSFSVLKENEDKLENRAFLAAECDCKMRSTWFDCEENEDTIKSVAQLIGMYELSVGRGSNFLLNIGPDARGLLPEEDVIRLREFGLELKRRYGNALPFEAMEKSKEGTDDEYEIRTAGFKPEWAGKDAVNYLVDTVVLCEDLTDGESIQEFEIYGTFPVYRSKEILLYRGYTVGHKTFCRFPAFHTGRIRVKITKHDGAYQLKDMKAYFAG